MTHLGIFCSRKWSIFYNHSFHIVDTKWKKRIHFPSIMKWALITVYSLKLFSRIMVCIFHDIWVSFRAVVTALLPVQLPPHSKARSLFLVHLSPVMICGSRVVSVHRASEGLVVSPCLYIRVLVVNTLFLNFFPFNAIGLFRFHSLVFLVLLQRVSAGGNSRFLGYPITQYELLDIPVCPELQL